jgi:glycosyltransferase involved in cell wall biosynthesis
MNINFCAPINQTGYGVASLNILKELSRDHSISLFPIGKPILDNQYDYELILSLYNNQTSSDIHSPYIKIWHQFDLADHYGRGPYYAFPFFELDTFNLREIKHMSVPDVLFITSKWAKEVISNNNIKTNTVVVPLGVDLSVFDYTKYNQPQKDKYVFLNIGKWEVRKGHDILYDVFKNAFPDETDVELWILASEKTNSYSDTKQLDEWKKIYSQDSRIKLFNGVDSHADIARLISSTDCGIYISRAEGWNLELLETMAMNKPVIATAYSAHTEFCNQYNSYLINITETEKAIDNKAFIGQGNWAKIGNDQIDQTINYMRYVYNNRIKSNIEGLKTAQLFSWKNSADIISGCINS